VNYSTRKEIAAWITDVKGTEARARRADLIAARLLATMEGERELPPILQVAFAHNARAREGWERMFAVSATWALAGNFLLSKPGSAGPADRQGY
jgi:hypothetical protein